MSADTGTMVIAGQAGGKSTFIGALTTYLRDIHRDRWQGEYNVLYGREDQFVNHIYDRISNKQAYPDQTIDTDTYLVRVRSHTDSGYSAERSLTMMDIPGERQEVAIDRLVSRNWTEEGIREAYEEGVAGERKSIREKVDKGRGLSDEEEEKLFIYQYLASNRVIVLLNLYKFIEKYNDPKVEDPIISPELVEMAARDRRCLLLVTAADMIDYDPEDFRSGMLSGIGSLIGSPTMFDPGLEEHIEQTPQLPPNQATNDIRKLVTTAKNNDASMFSVSVPEASGNRIANDGIHIETRGFDNVAEWLFET